MNAEKTTLNDIREFVTTRRPGSGSVQEKGSDWPRISVIVPSFNQGRFLERTILSILNQDYPNTELIIVDGGSSDETLSIIRQYEASIDYWVSEPDNGQSHALNKGLAVATGEIFAWQNSDDLYLQGAFETVSRVFRSNPQVGVCYGNWVAIDENDRVTDVHYALRPRLPHAPFENMDAYNQSMFWRCSVCRQIGGFDEQLHSLMDTEFIIRSMRLLGPAGFRRVDAFLGAFRWHSSQKTDFCRMTDKQLFEERYIESKFGFPPKASMEGKYHRIRYRFAQLFESFYYGGTAYTLKKFETTYRRRGKFL